MRIRTTLVATLVLMFAGSGATATTTAAGQADTKCTVEVIIGVSPGLSQEASSGPYHTDGETGRMRCADGRSGTYGTDGRYGTEQPATCSSGGEGWGVNSYTLDGANVRDTYTIVFPGMSQGTLQGSFDGERFSGTWTFSPTEGDCVTKPMSRGTLKIDGTLKG
jgi:hypothetical protein